MLKMLKTDLYSAIKSEDSEALIIWYYNYDILYDITTTCVQLLHRLLLDDLS